MSIVADLIAAELAAIETLAARASACPYTKAETLRYLFAARRAVQMALDTERGCVAGHGGHRRVEE